jgi:hypothetical protein
MIKDIHEQIAEWHENNEPAKIIKLLESLPPHKLTNERVGWLARAYNNLAAQDDNPEHYETAIRVLESVRDEATEKDELWNHRMGFALYQLDREGEAAEYFIRTLEGEPYESLAADTKEMLADCYKYLAFPRYTKGSFADRVEKAWEAFAEQEAELRQLVDNGASGDEIQELAFSSLKLAFPNLAFEIGSQNYHIILSADGTWMLYPLFRFFLSRMPESVREHWKFSVGRTANPDLYVDFGEGVISAEEVLVYFTKDEGGESISVGVYHPLLLEGDSPAWWRAEVLVDNAVGELVNTEFISVINVLEEAPSEEDSFKLSELRDMLAMLYSKDPRWENIDVILQGTMNYRFGDQEDIKPTDLRLDIQTGTTAIPRLVSEFAKDESGLMDLFHRFGCVGGFFAFDVPGLDEMEEAEREAAIDAACSALENHLRTHPKGYYADFIGRAVGRFHVYVDFLAFDIQKVCDAAFEFFKQYDTSFAAFQTYRRDVDFFNMKKTEG